jgi:putative ABC transport system permease protein
MPDLLPDLRYGLRLLARARGFAAAAILTVALGVGATTAIFSVVYGVLLRPLPFHDPARLVSLWSSTPTLPRALVGAANARDWRQQNHVFTDIALVRHVANFNVTRDGEPERLQGARISANLLRVLGVQPMLGRDFRDGEDDIGRDSVALLSYGLWQRRYAGDPDIVGRTIDLNGDTHTVVGVMGPDFRYPSREFDIWKPLTINPDDYRTRDNWGFLSVARLKPDVTLAQAQADMDTVSANLRRAYPDASRDATTVVAPMQEDGVSDVKTALFVLLGAVGLLLLIGCANLANLLLARALGRRTEYAIRGALGASRGRLLLQSVGEVLPIVAIGGALGLVAAVWMLRALVPFLPASMPRVEAIAVNGPVLAFAAALLTLTALLTGLPPALHASRRDLAASMRALSRGASGSVTQTRVRSALVLTQIAAAVMLSVGAGLLIRTFAEVRQIDPGFRADGVLGLHLAIPRSKYATDPDVAAFCQRALARVAALPGVEAVGLVNRLPLAGGAQTGVVQFSNESPAVTPAARAQFHLRSASPDYFRAMGIRLLQGRGFTDADDEQAPAVTIVDAQLARLIWPDRNPLGQRVRSGGGDAAWATVIGVVGHVSHDRIEDDARPQIYWNYRQRTQDRMAMVVRTRLPPATLAQPVAAAIREIDPEQPVYDVRTMDQVVNRAVSQRWLNMVLISTFAGIAVLLASIGIYGVLAYAVTQRAREFGIRLALGATRADLLALVLRQAFTFAASGAAAGLLGALLLARVIQSLLFKVGAYDAMTFGAATVVLMAVALMAGYLPARRAARTDPMTSLRSE